MLETATDTNTTPDFAALSLALQSLPLQLEGGNVMIKLGDGPQDVLLLHESVLAAASNRFAIRLKSEHWKPTQEVEVPEIKEGGETLVKAGEGNKTKGNGEGETMATEEVKQNVIRVYEYQLAQVEDTFSLTDEPINLDEAPEAPPEEWWMTPQPQYMPFSASSLVDGYQRVSRIDLRADKDVLAASIYEHKVLFVLLYRDGLDLDLETPEEALYTLNDVTALAEYYLLLPSIAHRVTALVEAVPGIWRLVSQDPEPFLALSSKLRAFYVFNEAMRHLVRPCLEYPATGQHIFCGPTDDVTKAIADYCLAQMRDAADGLRRQLRSIGLSSYQARPEAETRRKQGPLVRTTWLATGLGRKALVEKCKWIAASIYREKLDQLMYGEEHWSHVEYIRNGKKNGDVEAGSLFIACKAIMAAHLSPNTLDVFGHDAATKFAGIFGLHRTPDAIPAGIIAGELGRLVRSAVHAIQFWLPLPGAPANQYARGEPAKYQGVEYFTSLRVYGGLCSEDVDDWGELDGIVEAVAASEAWVKILGL